MQRLIQDRYRCTKSKYTRGGSTDNNENKICQECRWSSWEIQFIKPCEKCNWTWIIDIINN